MALAEQHDLTVQELASKTFLKPDQRRELEQSIEHMEFMLTDRETRESGVAPDTEMLEINIRRDKRTLELGTPPDYAVTTKNKLNALRKKIEEDITHAMPSRDMMEDPTPGNIDHHIWWERINKKRILAWKSVCRILDPHNTEPNFTSIARLRTNTPPKVDSRRYWHGFENVRWEEQIEENLILDLDDEAYQSFLELKLLDWSKMTICKQLSWSSAMYDAAMTRLHNSKNTRETVEREQEITKSKEEETYREEVKSMLASAKAKVAEDKSKKPDPNAYRSEWPFPELEELGVTMYQFLHPIGLNQMAIHAKLKAGTLSLAERSAMAERLEKMRQLGYTPSSSEDDTEEDGQ